MKNKKLFDKIIKNNNEQLKLFENTPFYLDIIEACINSSYTLNSFTIKIEISDNKIIILKDLDIKKAGDFKRRSEAFINMLKECSKIYKLPNIIFYVNFSDSPHYSLKHEPVFFISKNILDKKTLLIPDNSFFDYEPENKSNKEKLKMLNIDDLRNKINKEKDIKENKIFFIGSNTHFLRTLIKSNDVFSIFLNQYMPMEKYANFKILLNLPGISPWSFRFKFLFMMNSLVVNITYKKKFENILDQLFIENEDYINIEYNDGDNLEELIINKLSSFTNDEIEKIIKNGFEKGKVLKMKNIYYLIYKLLCNYKNYFNKEKDIYDLNNNMIRIINKGYLSTIYETLNPDEIIKKVHFFDKIRYAQYNEMKIYTITNRSKLFLKCLNMFFIDNILYLILEKADCSIIEKPEQIDKKKCMNSLKKSLDFLHKNNIVHSDVQPKNVLMKGYNYYLIDFNISYITYDNNFIIDKIMYDDFLIRLNAYSKNIKIYPFDKKTKKQIIDNIKKNFIFKNITKETIENNLKFSSLLMYKYKKINIVFDRLKILI